MLHEIMAIQAYNDDTEITASRFHREEALRQGQAEGIFSALRRAFAGTRIERTTIESQTVEHAGPARVSNTGW